jgi:glycosyltransferase involved in cell wall biosynthesis
MEETVSIAWCDNGMVDGKFMQGVTDVMLHSGIKFATTLRSQGNQIGRQRETAVNYWYDNNKSDWLLWVDSDVVLSPEVFLKLWKKKDALNKPLLTGVYFTTDTPEEPLMIPMPTVFEFVNEKNSVGIKRIHPLPENQFLKVGAAGMGFVLMHRSVVDKIKAAVPGAPLFTEIGVNKSFMGEDIYFFALCDKADVPVWCDTSAVVPHMKRFSFDEHYYKAFFGKSKEEPKSKLITPDKKIITPR